LFPQGHTAPLSITGDAVASFLSGRPSSMFQSIGIVMLSLAVFGQLRCWPAGKFR
jgi:hypothetical protein